MTEATTDPAELRRLQGAIKVLCSTPYETIAVDVIVYTSEVRKALLVLAGAGGLSALADQREQDAARIKELEGALGEAREAAAFYRSAALSGEKISDDTDTRIRERLG